MQQFVIFTKECRLLSDKLESMEIKPPRDSMLNPRVQPKGFSLNFHQF